MTVPEPPKRKGGPKRLRSERRQNRLVGGNTEQIPKKSAKHW
jgi:hypothetical protein